MILMEKVKRFFRSYSKRIVAFVLSFGIMCISVLSSPINAHASTSALNYITFDFGGWGHMSGSDTLILVSGNSGINNRQYEFLSTDFSIPCSISGLDSSSLYKRDVYTTFTISPVYNTEFLGDDIYKPYNSTGSVSKDVQIYRPSLTLVTSTGTYDLPFSSSSYTVSGYPISVFFNATFRFGALFSETSGLNEGLIEYGYLATYSIGCSCSFSSLSVTTETVRLPSNITNSIAGGSGSSLTGSSDAASTNTSFGENITSVNDTSDGYFDSFSTNMDSLDVVSNLSSIGVGFASVKLWMEAFYDKLPTPLQSVIFVSLYVGIIALLLSVLGRIKSHGGS